MSVNFNANSIANTWAGIDVQNVNNVTEQIFQRAQQKTVDLAQVDLTKFNRPTQGIDLYSQNVSLETQRLIAMQNSGLFVNANNAVAQLNAQAAINLYGGNVAQKVNGNMTIAITEGEHDKNLDVQPVLQSVKTVSTSNIFKDKMGSNSLFYEKSSSETEDKEELDIQA